MSKTCGHCVECVGAYTRLGSVMGFCLKCRQDDRKVKAEDPACPLFIGRNEAKLKLWRDCEKS